jgi:hypothetical protein
MQLPDFVKPKQRATEVLTETFDAYEDYIDACMKRIEELEEKLQVFEDIEQERKRALYLIGAKP